jgi:hypothetical protein
MIRRLKMPIHDRNLKAGTTLIGKYHKQPFTCEVVEVESKLCFRLEDGREFKSPSAAGMAITGHPCDGWVFWSVETPSEASTTEVKQEPSPKEPTEQNPQAPETEVEPTLEQVPEQTTPIFFKMEWQKAVPKGQTRWHCNVCNKHFLAPADTTPETCPQGHKAS